ncbi:hypothetical protein [Amycolatopsis suaedae]|uniref:Uncharacterized protein n=1 Tax=Amycolatopsis suaedae TaxID=2510978 RepID=A0A4Q7JGI7_9PSEU|nr:hypothetical protein [Amycolatopsis suaedae]RZQ65924.1 hypothetical protein EWH70_02295 [Amycolatopsis suaedae]
MSDVSVLAPAPHVPVRRRLPALLVAVILLAATTTSVNLVLPGWAYPLSGVFVVAALVALARRTGVGWAALGLSRRHLRRATTVGLAGLGLVTLGFVVALPAPGPVPPGHELPAAPVVAGWC